MRRFSFLILYILMFFSAAAISNDTSKSLRVGSVDIYPYGKGRGGESNPTPGMFASIAKRLFAGETYELPHYPLKRLKTNFKEGKLDAAFIIHEEKELGSFQKLGPIMRTPIYLCNPENRKLKGQFSVAILAGTSALATYRKKFPRAVFREANTHMQMAKLLENERVDVAVVHGLYKHILTDRFKKLKCRKDFSPKLYLFLSKTITPNKKSRLSKIVESADFKSIIVQSLTENNLPADADFFP